VNNINVNCTPTGVSHRDFSILKNIYGDVENFTVFDAQTGLNFITNDFLEHQANRINVDMDVSHTPRGVFHQDFSTLRNIYWDGEKIPEMSAQAKLDLRRYDVIANDFWGHQARRRNGDMTVGDIILPWVRVWNEVP